MRSETVDVVILELVMPDLNGLEVLDRALELTPGLMVVIASVIDTSQSALQALRRGATDYFVKPTDPEVTKMVVRRRRCALSRPSSTTPTSTTSRS